MEVTVVESFIVTESGGWKQTASGGCEVVSVCGGEFRVELWRCVPGPLAV